MGIAILNTGLQVIGEEQAFNIGKKGGRAKREAPNFKWMPPNIGWGGRDRRWAGKSLRR